jgi:hypothetical protein
MTDRTGPPPPGSPEARAIIARFIATRCADVDHDVCGRRCGNVGVFVRAGQRWCAEHAPPIREGAGGAAEPRSPPGVRPSAPRRPSPR